MDAKNFSLFAWAVFNLINSITGSGVLGLAYAASLSGVALITAIMVAVSMLVACTFYVLTKVHFVKYKSALTLDDIVTNSMGRVAGALAKLTILLQSLASVASYLKILWDDADILTHNPIANYVIVGVVGALVWGLSCMPYMRFLGPAALMSFCCVVYYIAAVCVHWGGTWHTTAHTAPPGVGGLLAIPIVLFAMTGHLGVIQSCEDLDSLRKRMAACCIASAVTGFMYMAVAWAGYLTFGMNVEGNIFRSFSRVDAPAYIYGARITTLISVILTIPPTIVPLKACLLTYVTRPNIFWHMGFAFALLIGSAAITIAAGSLTIIFSATGGFVSPLLIIVWPCLLYYKELAKSRCAKVVAILLAGCGCVCSLAFTGLVIVGEL
ncbi:N system amino acids transporter NAT-1 [Grouper iridovirus]|uniref:N system amino acids transporter NAT-1 n=1 Tax=Grouper iridovirus TaxID=127569 RepID=Q5GAC1_9VIRU|nr:N system amino acids transporter NAT-1 [Grouper iridovirus]